MSLYGFYANKQDSVKLSLYGLGKLYCYELERELAKDRLRKMFRASQVDRIVDEVC